MFVTIIRYKLRRRRREGIQRKTMKRVCIIEITRNEQYVNKTREIGLEKERKNVVDLNCRMRIRELE